MGTSEIHGGSLLLHSHSFTVFIKIKQKSKAQVSFIEEASHQGRLHTGLSPAGLTLKTCGDLLN